MIELNLLPENMRIVRKQKKSSVNFNMPKLPMLPVIIAVISVVVLFHLIIGIIGSSQGLRLRSLNTKLSNLSSREQEAVSLKKEVDRLSNKITVIDGLSSTSLVWSKKLFDLNQSITEGTWLISLYLDEKKPDKKGAYSSSAAQRGKDESAARQMLVLRGSAFSQAPAGETAVIGRFIESLKNNRDFFEDFEDVELSSTQSKKLGDTDVMDFVIECYFKTGRRYFDKL